MIVRSWVGNIGKYIDDQFFLFVGCFLFVLGFSLLGIQAYYMYVYNEDWKYGVTWIIGVIVVVIGIYRILKQRERLNRLLHGTLDEK